MKQRLWTRLSASPWLVPLLGLWLISAVDDELVDLVGFDNAAGIILALGGIFGAAWYFVSPRPLAERLYPFAVLAVVIALLMLMPGFDSDTDFPGALSIPGLVIGLVLAERHVRPRVAKAAPVAVERTR